MKKLLVIVDMQEDFVRGALGSARAQAILPAVISLMRQAEAEDAEIVFTQDTHGDDYAETQEGRLLPVPHCIRGTHGHDIVPELVRKEARIFEKGAFGSLALARYVAEKGFCEVTLCGVCTDICVVSNALLIKAHAPETVVRVAANACAGTTEQRHAAALDTMRSCQIMVDGE